MESAAPAAGDLADGGGLPVVVMAVVEDTVAFGVDSVITGSAFLYGSTEYLLRTLGSDSMAAPEVTAAEDFIGSLRGQSTPHGYLRAGTPQLGVSVGLGPVWCGLRKPQILLRIEPSTNNLNYPRCLLYRVFTGALLI